MLTGGFWYECISRFDQVGEMSREGIFFCWDSDIFVEISCFFDMIFIGRSLELEGGFAELLPRDEICWIFYCFVV